MSSTHSRRVTWFVYAGLLGLLALSAASSRVDLGWANNAVNLGAAVCKAALIAAFYMRLRGSAGAVRLTIIVTFLMFALLLGLSLTDVLTRNVPPGGEAPAEQTGGAAASAETD